MNIRAFEQTDWPVVKAIYEEGIETRNATFELATPTLEAWLSKIAPNCHLVAELDGKVVAFAKVMWTSDRFVFRGVGEVSIYVGNEAKGRGVGKALLNALIETSEDNGFWTLKSVIFPENEASIALHEKCGFRTMGIHEKVGELDGIWRDNVVMERRSKRVGV